MSNFFLDNRDLQSRFERLDLLEIISALEHDFLDAGSSDSAPASYDETLDYYRSALELIGKISAERIAPRACAVDLEGSRLVNGRVHYAEATQANIKDLGESGFMGVIVPRAYGGLGFPATIYMMMIEIVSRADASLMTVFGYQDVGEAIAKYGTPEQAKEFLKDYVKGAAIGSMVMTEPGAGSDLQAIRLKAYQDADGRWYLRGRKHFISNGNGDVLLVVARSVEGSDDMFGLSLFACHGTSAVKVTRLEDKMGLHGSPTCELYFDDAPAELIGKRRSGMLYVLNILNHARFSVAAQALGIAEGAYREALAHAEDRKQFGKRLIDMPAVANMLIDMQCSLEAMRSMLYAGSYWLDLRNTLEERIEHLKSNAEPYTEEKKRFDQASKVLNLLSPMTKYVVTDTAVRICYDAQQLHGGMGYMREMAVERMARDVRITTIYEGASEVQIASCWNSVRMNVLGKMFDQLASENYGAALEPLKNQLDSMRVAFHRGIDTVKARQREDFTRAAMRRLVDTYAAIWTGYLLLADAKEEKRKYHVARRHIVQAAARADATCRVLDDGLYADLEHRDLICN